MGGITWKVDPPAPNKKVGSRVFPLVELGKELALQLQYLRLRPRVSVGFKRLLVQGLEGRAPLVEREEPLRLRILSEDEERCSERLEGAQDPEPRVVRGVGREQPGEASMLPPELPEEDLLRLPPRAVKNENPLHTPIVGGDCPVRVGIQNDRAVGGVELAVHAPRQLHPDYLSRGAFRRVVLPVLKGVEVHITLQRAQGLVCSGSSSTA